MYIAAVLGHRHERRREVPSGEGESLGAPPSLAEGETLQTGLKTYYLEHHVMGYTCIF